MNDANSEDNHSTENSKHTPSSETSEDTSSSSIFSDINTPLSTINNINSLKTALCDLPLNPCEQRFIATNITPLLSVLDLLGRVSYDLSYSVTILTNSPIVKPKRHKLIETIHTIYDINDQCQDIYDVIEPRVDTVLKGKC